jgi:hypothetical protein
MGDTKHPGIEAEIKAAEASLKRYADLSGSQGELDYSTTGLLARVGQVGHLSGENYQNQMNEYLLGLIRDVAEMILNVSDAVGHLKKAIDLMPKRKPTPLSFDEWIKQP